MKVRALDLFCGAGGSSWGAREAGVEIVAAFDLWPLAGEAHRINFPESAFIEGRLEDQDLKTLVKQFGEIDLILASPECTNHSPAKGNKPRCEESKGTAFQVVRFAKAFKPRWLIIENVVNMRKWTRYGEFKEELERLGYNLHEQVLNSAHFAVPQSRRRLFLLADQVGRPPVIKPRKMAQKKVVDLVDLNGSYRWSPLRSPRRAKATLERADRGIAELGKEKPFLLVYYGTDGCGGWQKLERPLRTITTVDRFAIVKPDKIHGHVMRMLQVPELQAAMGMPKQMKLESGTRRDRIKMIGNAVCPPVMKNVVKTLTSKGVM
ncbi:DNA cytosine methyltransferase [Cerasicoccus maritimus]|uniref:DNA cytosine methyltransferase n=1 Tax=Cerasicoccus maritimus TaxID=490089 RepID=UPI0028526836|nr:DNA cytosine methyltransferase [Cerasicoccus maritimus]